MGSVTLSYQSSFPLDSTDAQMQSASVYESFISGVICIAFYQCVARIAVLKVCACVSMWKGKVRPQGVFAEIELL